MSSAEGQNPFFSASYLVCFRYENAVINVELAALSENSSSPAAAFFHGLQRLLFHFMGGREAVKSCSQGAEGAHRGRDLGVC